MITASQGNILDANAEALVVPVNCVGIAGKGLAMHFKKEFPKNFVAYRRECCAGTIRLGRVFTFPTGLLMNPKYIINFPTKGKWDRKSKIDYIEAGLTSLVAEVVALGLSSIAIPALGCGSDMLDWKEVRPIIHKHFTCLKELHVLLFAPLD